MGTMTRARERKQHKREHPTRARLKSEVALYHRLGKELEREAKN